MMAGASSQSRAGAFTRTPIVRLQQGRIHRWPSAPRIAEDAEPAGPVAVRAGDSRVHPLEPPENPVRFTTAGWRSTRLCSWVPPRPKRADVWMS